MFGLSGAWTSKLVIRAILHSGKEALYALCVVQWLGVGRHRGGHGDDDPGPLQQTHSLGNLVTNWHLLVPPVKRFFNVVSDFLLSQLSLPCSVASVRLWTGCLLCEWG